MINCSFALLSSCSSLTTRNQTHYHVFRLTPGQDLKNEILSYVNQNKIEAGAIVSIVGSLKTANLRFADQGNESRLNGPFEILSLSGTVSTNGSHLHLSIADFKGKTLGGHLLEQNIVYTTAEIVMIEFNDIIFKRELDSQTTFKELKVLPKE